VDDEDYVFYDKFFKIVGRCAVMRVASFSKLLS